MDDRLLEYIESCIAQGHKKEHIKEQLRSAGHDPAVVEAHLQAAHHKANPRKKTAMYAVIGIVVLVGVWFMFFRGETSEAEEQNKRLLEAKLTEVRARHNPIQTVQLEHVQGTVDTELYACGDLQCVTVEGVTLALSDPGFTVSPGTHIETFCVQEDETCVVHHPAKIVIEDDMIDTVSEELIGVEE
ncbi:MAG: hypothetical protein OXR66_01830 [Candidatus Woesearchaeota archaeon]|nr:hypothetical protein [Candidatus Woesearchaeota archaeon]